MGVEQDSIDMLFVRPEARGLGAGRTLVAYAIHTLGAVRVDVNEQNEQAVGFYEHLGFRQVSRSPLDPFGKPFPILHMKLIAVLQPNRNSPEG
jgi:putative acetyltransferase